MGTYIVGGILIVCFAGAIYKIVKDKKKGGCTGCSGCCNEACKKEQEKKKP